MQGLLELRLKMTKRPPGGLVLSGQVLHNVIKAKDALFFAGKGGIRVRMADRNRVGEVGRTTG
ncbi:MAG: hypothetical protein OEV08_08220 [Nitrospira sp.]|nr:hypothetical protein [Nitrospira sp.]